MKLETFDPGLTLKVTPPRLSRSHVGLGTLSLDGERLRGKSSVFLHAPAGFGKTSLLGQWRREALRRGAVVAWLSLDERDTADRIVRGLRMALLLGQGATQAAIARAILIVQGQTATEAATAWLAEIGTSSGQTVLVLDDVQAVQDPVAHELLAYVAFNAPSNLQLLLASRTDLPVVMAPVNVALVLQDDLLLRIADTTAIVAAQLGSDAGPVFCSRIHELSGGWPLGLQLLISTVKPGTNLQEAMAGLSIETGDVSHYFRHCLEDGLPIELQDFLLRLSIPDIVSPSLAVAVTGRADAGETLESLCKLTPIFGQMVTQDWMRMHSLARDFLRTRALTALSQDDLNNIHAKASAWFALHHMPERAARHAFEAGRTELAYDLAEACLHEVSARGDFQRVVEWFDRIPPDEVKRRPRLVLPASWALSCFAGRRPEARQLFRGVLENSAVALEVRAEAAAAMIVAAGMNDDAAVAAKLCAAWEPHFGQGHRLLDEAVMYHRALCMMYSGQPGPARHIYEESPSGGGGFFLTRIALLSTVATTYYWEGRLAHAEAVLRPELASVEAELGRRCASATYLASALAMLRWEQDDVDGAVALLADRMDLVSETQGFRVTMMGYKTAAFIALDTGNEAKALELLDHMLVLGQTRQQARLCWESLVEQIRIHAHKSRARTCATLLARLEAMSAGLTDASRSYAAKTLELRLQMARAYTHFACGEFQSASDSLEAAAVLANRLQLRREDIICKALQSLVKQRLGIADDRLIEEARSLAALYGFKRIIRDAHPDLAEEPLAQVAESTAPKRFSPVDSGAREDSTSGRSVTIAPTSLLTRKEREVLLYLAEGAGNKRIAAAMDVGTETVKWHVKNLCAKLGATNRKHVVDRARQIGILS